MYYSTFRIVHAVHLFLCIFVVVAVGTINGSGLSGVDFEVKNEVITVSPVLQAVESSNVEIIARALDENCELDEKQFQMEMYAENGALIGSTVNITINPDTQCGKPFILYWYY